MIDGRPVEVRVGLARPARALVALRALVVLALALIAIGRYFSIRQPTPYLARVADIIDILTSLAIIPAMFLAFYPQLGALNVMGLASPQSAILSAIIFNALIIVALIPLSLKGVRYRAIGAGALLSRNLLVYGLGGIVVPFVGIKLIDMAVSAIGLV